MAKTQLMGWPGFNVEATRPGYPGAGSNFQSLFRCVTTSRIALFLFSICHKGKGNFGDREASAYGRFR
jgi:hypothetical protein